MRSQPQNIKAATEVLTARVYDFYREQKEQETQRPENIQPVRGSGIRLYDFSSSLVHDRNTGMRTSDIEGFFRGNGLFQRFIYAAHGINF